MKVVKVTGTRVLIKEDEGEKESKSGIILPDMVYASDATGLQKHVRTGTVLNAGQDCGFCKKDMRVLYGRGSAANIEHGNEKYVVVREAEALFSFTGTEIEELNDDRVLIEPDPKENMTESGIYIPESAAYRPSKGRILKIGHQCKEIAAGEDVIFGNRAGTLIEFSGKNYVIVREADIVGKYA